MAVKMRKPKKPLPPDYRPPNTVPHRVETGENLVSIAARYGLSSWRELTRLNWNTDSPPEVNYYLHHNVGCRTPTADGNNYSFRTSDNPGIIYVPAASVPRPGGGNPGDSSNRPPEENQPDDTGGRAAPERNRIARNQPRTHNTLKPPSVRLPVGWMVPVSAATTRLYLWVPTNTGGTLTICYESGGTVDLRRPFSKVLKPAAEKVVYEVPKGEFGRFDVIAKGTPGERVSCTFEQISFSRNGIADSDPPLVPWNFYYWPTALQFGTRKPDGTWKDLRPNPWSDHAAELVKKYAIAFGKNGDDAYRWEKKWHGNPDIGEGWEGHCHNSAPASMLFDLPTPKKHSGQSFDEEEMEQLGTEYTGNFSKFGYDWWSLKRGDKPGGANKRWYVPGYFKPGEPKTKANFIKGLKAEGFRDSSGPRSAETIAQNYVTNYGGDGPFADKINQWFGELAAEFYQNLIKMIRVKKHPILSNMRSYRGGGGAHEVWNQAYFWYLAWYQENGDTEDDKDIIITQDLYANLDAAAYTTESQGLPAKIENNQVTPDDSKSLSFKNIWRIQFDDSGKIKINDTKNEWRHLVNYNDEELYAPTGLLVLDKPSATRPTVSDSLPDHKKRSKQFGLGNEYVGQDLVTSGLLKIRKRYT